MEANSISGDKMLIAENVTKYYKDHLALNELNLSLEAGSGLGIIGVNGSGKTTFFKVLLGLLKADGGTIKFKGKRVSEHPNSILGYLPEERCLYKDLIVVDHVLFLGRLKGMNDTLIIERLDKLLAYLKIPHYKFSKINKLSKGNQQKVQIICALIHDPQIIILDEPLSGLDIVNVNLLKSLIHDLKRQGKYILLSSHQFDHIEQFCEHLIILKNGNTTYRGSLDELITSHSSFHIRMNKNLSEKYIDKIEHISLKDKGRYVEFEIANKALGYEQFKKIVTEEENEAISLVESDIEQIVREKDYI